MEKCKIANKNNKIQKKKKKKEEENEVKNLLPQSRRTRKINDKMQQEVVKSLFSQSLLRQINDKVH